MFVTFLKHEYKFYRMLSLGHNHGVANIIFPHPQYLTLFLSLVYFYIDHANCFLPELQQLATICRSPKFPVLGSSGGIVTKICFSRC